MRKRKTTPDPLPKMQLPPRIKPPLMGARMPPFSGDRTSCTKCGHTSAKTTFMHSGRACAHTGDGPRIVWGLQRLHRTCDRCQFTWDEACVPAIPAITQHTMVMPAIRD
jgi:hypothetical protein